MENAFAQKVKYLKRDIELKELQLDGMREILRKRDHEVVDMARKEDRFVRVEEVSDAPHFKESEYSFTEK